MDNSAERIERALFDRTRRLVAGLHVDDRFESISGSLVVARGRGKSLRVLYCDSIVRPIPEVIRSHALELTRGSYSGADFRSCIGELADFQSAVVEELKLKARKYVDRILAVSVTDPGLWHKEIDGALSYSSLCDSTRLAERTGITVIDAWPDRDIAVGGNGGPLDPICLWLLLADRHRKIARKANVVLRVGNEASGYLLPPSDGLDAEVPSMQPLRTEGLELIEGLLSLSSNESVTSGRVRQLLVSGVHSKELMSAWKQIDGRESRTSAMLELARSPAGEKLSTEQLLCTAMKWISGDLQKLIQDALQQLKTDWADRRRELKAQIESSKHSKHSRSSVLDAFDRSLPDFENPGSIMVEASTSISDALVSRLQNLFSETQVSGSWREFLMEDPTGVSGVEVDGASLVAAILGLLHIDQMPANIPSLTGAHQQRILGRLTPGRPNSWRNLLREMADYEPSAMKLRDAV